MATYRLSAKLISRSSGRSATAAAAYRAAERIPDARTGMVHDYTSRGGVLHAEIMTPADTPSWMQDRAQLWNGVEAAEKRRDAQLAREVQLSLPHELNDRQRLDLVRGFIGEQFVARGMIADVAIHAPEPRGDHRNHHAHIMLTMRELTGEGFGKKDRSWNDTPLLENWRSEWERHANRALEKAGRKERIDHRSLEAQGLDREPEPKQGPIATEIEKQGRRSKAGDDRRAVQARNAERAAREDKRRIIDREIARRERELQVAERRAAQAQTGAIPPELAALEARHAGEDEAALIRFRRDAEARRARLEEELRLKAEEAERQRKAREEKRWEAFEAAERSLQRSEMLTFKGLLRVGWSALSSWMNPERQATTQMERERTARQEAFEATLQAEAERMRQAQAQAARAGLQAFKREELIRQRDDEAVRRQRQDTERRAIERDLSQQERQDAPARDPMQERPKTQAERDKARLDDLFGSKDPEARAKWRRKFDELAREAREARDQGRADDDDHDCRQRGPRGR